MCWASRLQIRQQSWASSIAVGSELAASFESAMMPSCCSPIRPGASKAVVVTAFDLVRGLERRANRTILAAVAESVAASVAGESGATAAGIVAGIGSSFGSESAIPLDY
jgi:hypothetical protein